MVEGTPLRGSLNSDVERLSDIEATSVVEQVHQKQSGSLKDWYDALHRGATEFQVRLENGLVRLRTRTSRLDLAAIVLTAISTGSLIVALGEYLGQQKLLVVIAAIINTLTAIVIGFKKYYEDNGLVFRYEDLHDLVIDFRLSIWEPKNQDNHHEVLQKLLALERKVIRVAPELRAEKPWDNMTESARQQFLQQRMAQ